MVLNDLKRKKMYELEVQQIENFVAGLNIKDKDYCNALVALIKGELARPMYEDGTYPEMDRDYADDIKTFAKYVIDTEITGSTTEQLKQLYDIVLREFNAFVDIFNRYKEGAATGTELFLQKCRFYVAENEFDDVLNENALESDNRYPELAFFYENEPRQVEDNTRQECIETIEHIIYCINIVLPFAANAIELEDKERYYYASLFLGSFSLQLCYPATEVRKRFQ